MVTDYWDHFVMCKNIEQLCCVPESINSSVVGQLYFRKHKRDQILVTEGGGGGIEWRWSKGKDFLVSDRIWRTQWITSTAVCIYTCAQWSLWILITRKKLPFVLYLYEMKDVHWTFCCSHFMIDVSQIVILYILNI